jgi:hypothetical protein
MRTAVAIVAVIFLAGFSVPARAQAQPAPAPAQQPAPPSAQEEEPSLAPEAQVTLQRDRIRAVRVPPTDARHKPYHDWLQQQGILELLHTLLSPLRLPRELKLETRTCGKLDAYYEDDVVTVCYEYIEHIRSNAPKVSTPGGLSPNDMVKGATIDLFLHEVGHAVFDMLEVPIFGREEDAADFFSVYILLQFDADDARRLIQGVGFLLANEAKANEAEKTPDVKSFADIHGTPAQRYYNVLCMAYGSDPKTFANAVARGLLPKKRADGCEEEYELLERAFTRLIVPYFDEQAQREARARIKFNWEPPVAASDRRDPSPMQQLVPPPTVTNPPPPKSAR